MELAKKIVGYANVVDMVDETVNGKDIKKHPGPIIHENEITAKERQWQDVGSGVFARTFPRSERLVTTMRGGPPVEDVHRRTIWSLSKGRVIHDCIVDDVSDHELNKMLEETDDIRVELTMKGAMKMYNKTGADVSEVYSQPRVAQAAAEDDTDGMKLQPGFSLDLTRADPTTGRAWDLSSPQVQSRVTKLVRETRPLLSDPHRARYSRHCRTCRRPRETPQG